MMAGVESTEEGCESLLSSSETGTTSQQLGSVSYQSGAETVQIQRRRSPPSRSEPENNVDPDTNPTWWKRRTALERGLITSTVAVTLIGIGLAVALGILSPTPEDCKTKTLPPKMEMLPASTQALRSKKPPTGTTTVNSKSDAINDICLTPGCIRSAVKILDSIDPDVEPCDDFYQFACGRFLKTTIIPDDRTSVTAFMTINDKLEEQLRISIEEEIQPDEPNAFKLAKWLYQACVNKTAIEERGLTPAKDMLTAYGGWPVVEGDKWDEKKFEWKESVYEFRKVGLSVDYFFDFSVGIDMKNSTRRVLDIDQATLGLAREYLIKGFSDKIVMAYYSYMVDIAVIFGADRKRAKAELKESLEFEMKLANMSLSSEDRRNGSVLYNPMTVKELSGNYTSIPWLEYFNNIMQPFAEIAEDEYVIVNVPSYFRKFEVLMKETPKRVQANYALWRALSSTINFLNEEVRKRQLEYSHAVYGRAEREPRWKECIGVTSGSLGLAVGALYVRKYFDEDAKQSAIEMVAQIRLQFMNMLKQVEWMDEKTRQSALEKADSMSTHIAYPDELLDDKKLEEFYEKLEITPDDYLQTIMNLTLFGSNYSFSRLRKPVNKSDWVSHGRPAIVNAFYSSIENSIQFPAGILQGTFYSNDRPRYMNYGAIGFVIGHEITHGFDDQGRQFDKHGNLVEWWEPSTKTKYLEKAKCIIEQYGNYTAKEVGLNMKWMDLRTMRSAWKKALHMKAHIGYPDELMDFNKLENVYIDTEIYPGEYFLSRLSLRASDMDSEYTTFDKPNHEPEWLFHASNTATVNAYYTVTTNSIGLPAAVLQDVFFAKDRPEYLNYGAIGTIIGHEVVHAYDSLGRQYDHKGFLRNWWSPETERRYLDKVDCFIYQYGNYTVKELGKNVDGVTSQEENIADNGGLRQAYLAYQEWVSQNGPERKLPGLKYTPSQLFWISTAYMWCSKDRLESLKQDLKLGLYVPSEFRTNGAMSNSEYFAADFKCPVGSKMNPKKKCHLW